MKRIALVGEAVAAIGCAVLIQADVSAAEAQASDVKSGVSEEVIVTARKRAENIQDVPISIAVVSAEDITRRGLVSSGDYLRGIAGVNQVEGGPFTQSIVIRGIETSPQSQNFSSGSTVATYFGETPTTNTAGLAGNSNIDIKLVDVERVEVLRGPQGTAFGSSSLGGAVRILPTAPRLDRFEVNAGAGYSVTSGSGGDNYDVRGVVNVPLVDDRLAIRAVGYKYQDAGYYNNRAGSDARFNQTIVVPYGVQSFAVDRDEVGTYDVQGGRISALFQVTKNLRITGAYLSQNSEVDGVPTANSGTYQQSFLQVAPEHQRGDRRNGLEDADLDLLNATVEYSVGWANILATYSHLKSEVRNAFPFSYLGIDWPMSGDAHSEHKERVGELRMTTSFDGPLNFLVGVFHEKHDDGGLDQPYQTFYWYGAPATNRFAPNGASLVGAAFDQRDLEQTAFFGEATWEFADKWSLTAGARSYDYDRTRRFAQSGPFVGGASSWTNEADASGTNVRGNLSFKPTDGMLLFAGYSEGFRLGRPQNPLPASICDTDGNGIIDGTSTSLASTGTLNSDEVDSYELGGKFEFMDRRMMLETTVFRMEWDGMPVTFNAPVCRLNYSANAGAAKSEGVELQVTLQLADPLRLSVGGSYIDAKLTEDVPSNPGSSGNQLAGAAEVNANLGLQYDFSIGGQELSVRADSIYVGPFFGDILETKKTEAGDYVKVDLSGHWQLNDISVDLFVRNLTNEDAFSFRRTSSSTSPFYGIRMRPRTVGVQLNYQF